MRLVYKTGRERGEIVETQDFEESIFAEQYTRALSLVNQFIESKENSDTLKIVAFCGDRGEGKSSCMRTVLNMLAQNNDSNEKGIKSYIKNMGFNNIMRDTFEVLDVIDPSFFDKCHNVIELVLGRMYTQVIEHAKGKDIDSDYTYHNRIMREFQQAKKCLYTLHNSSDGHIDELQELDALAAGLELKKHMNELIRSFLALVKKEWLIVSIDDIDLNMSEAYRMCEDIRKYLASSQCIVFLGVKIIQLQDAISIAIKRDLNKITPDENVATFNIEVAGMSQKYTAKFLPDVSRINMPKVYSLCEHTLQIQTEEKDKGIESHNIKDTVVELIFNKTRYLFYNSKGGISPIIPNNLRDLITLIGLLVSMPSIDDSHKQKTALEANKHFFKSYFFSTWIERVPKKSRELVEKIIDYDLGNALNKTVVTILDNFFSKVQDRDYSNGEQDEESNTQNDTKTISQIKSIIDSRNFSYNVSLGDVFYLFRLIEMDSLDAESAALIFFLKSLYSIKLYETYEMITETADMVYPEDDVKTKGIYRIDARFNHTNPLQRLLCGGYFTYCPGDLLPLRGGTDAYDMRIINGKELSSLLKEIDEKIKNKTYKDDSNFSLQLQTAEFFILSITRSVPGKQKDNIISAIDKNRKNSDPFYLSNFTPERGYYLFDILAPFYNLANPKFAYRRFYKIVPNLYGFAMTYEGSLLYKMVTVCKAVRENIEHENDEYMKMHQLLSVAIIRNAEVLSAVYENAVLGRDNSHQAVNLDAIKNFYNRIQDSNMATHMDRYMISFNFLEPLHNFIVDLTSSEKVRQIFDSIFYISETPTYDQIMKRIGSATVIKTLYNRLRLIPYFQDWSDEQLAVIIPNDNSKLTKTQIRAFVRNWADSNK